MMYQVDNKYYLKLKLVAEHPSTAHLYILKDSYCYLDKFSIESITKMKVVAGDVKNVSRIRTNSGDIHLVMIHADELIKLMKSEDME